MLLLETTEPKSKSLVLRHAREHDTTREIIINNDAVLDQITEERDSLKIKVVELNDQLHEGGKLIFISISANLFIKLIPTRKRLWK
jgi:hypothetical protein